MGIISLVVAASFFAELVGSCIKTGPIAIEIVFKLNLFWIGRTESLDNLYFFISLILIFFFIINCLPDDLPIFRFLLYLYFPLQRVLNLLEISSELTEKELGFAQLIITFGRLGGVISIVDAIELETFGSIEGRELAGVGKRTGGVNPDVGVFGSENSHLIIFDKKLAAK